MKYNENPDKRERLTEEEINSPEFDPAEFAPAPDSEKKANNKHSSVLFCIMCTIFALLLSLVGSFAPMAVGNDKTAREHEVKELFAGASKVQYVKTSQNCEVYGVFYGEKLMGIGIYHTVKGFSDEIEILVAMNSDNAIEAVKVVKENESKGLGNKIRSDEFLSQFKGLTTFGADTKTDLITCATKSSDAVVGAIKDIFETGITTFSVAKELKVGTVAGDEVEKDKDDKDKDKDDSDETTRRTEYDRPDSEPVDSRELDGEGGHGNNNNGGGDMNLDGEDVTTVYETETGKDDTTEMPETTPVETETPVTDAPETKPVETEPPVTEPAETDPPETEPPVETTGEPETEPEG